jgi:hypothetical protein
MSIFTPRNAEEHETGRFFKILSLPALPLFVV